LTGPDGLLNLVAGFERKQRGIADEESGIGLPEHGDWIGGVLDKLRLRAEEFAKENLGVREGTARGRVGSYRSDCFESMACFDDELNRADAVERGDGATGDDGEIGRERSDGDKAEVRATGEEFVGAERRFGVVKGIAFGEFGRERRVLEVPHERGGIEEADGGDANGMG